MNFLEENREEKIHDINPGIDFMYMTPEAQAVKTKINKWDHIKLKSFCTVEKTISRGRPTGWEKIFANHVSDKS